MANSIRDELLAIAVEGISANPHPYDLERFEDSVKWSERLGPLAEDDLIPLRASIESLAKTGWSLSRSEEDRRRYERVIELATHIGEGGSFFGPPSPARSALDDRIDSVSSRYVTPRIGINAVVDDGSGRLLMIQRADRGEWVVPGGYADVGLNGAEVAAKETLEETGYEVEVISLLGEWNNLQHAGQRVPQYTLMYHCFVTGGSENRHQVETLDLQWFTRSTTPPNIWQDGDPWLEIALRAVEGVRQPTYFDKPRKP